MPDGGEDQVFAEVHSDGVSTAYALPRVALTYQP